MYTEYSTVVTDTDGVVLSTGTSSLCSLCALLSSVPGAQYYPVSLWLWEEIFWVLVVVFITYEGGNNSTVLVLMHL